MERRINLPFQGEAIGASFNPGQRPGVTRQLKTPP
jgi:hypothetical protein